MFGSLWRQALIWLPVLLVAVNRFFDDNAPPEYLAEVKLTRLLNTGLPQSMVFYSDGIINTTRARSTPKRYAPPYQHGFTNAIYTVTSLTNILGYEFPMQSELVVYVPKPSGTSRTDLIKVYKASLTITNIIINTASNYFIPKLIGLTLISDERFRDVGIQQILYTNVSWLPIDAVKTSAEFAVVRKATELLTRRTTTRTQWIFIYLILTILILPFGIILVKQMIMDK